MEVEGWAVTWYRISIGANGYSPWYARLPAAEGVNFALVSQGLDGKVHLSVFPHGPWGPRLESGVSSVAKGKEWIERWTRHHWRIVNPNPRQPG